MDSNFQKCTFLAFFVAEAAYVVSLSSIEVLPIIID